MFSECFCENIDIAPETSKEKIVKNDSSQTEAVQTAENSCQVLNRLNVEVQTDVPEISNDIFGECNTSAVAQFLNKVAPIVCRTLDKNISSQAFDRYRLLSDINSTTTTKLHSLEKGSLLPEFLCTDVSWSATGTMICAAYGSKSHESWCEHDSLIGIWSLNRKDFDSKKPTTVLETDCCITCVTFHPKLPAVLACGKFNGEIMLYNISKNDDPLIGKSEATSQTHREPITSLHFISDSSAPDKMKLVSCSLDGKILLWRLKASLLEPYDGFIIIVNDLPKSFSLKISKPEAEVGVTSMSINAEDPSIFIIGMEGGGICQCSFSATMPASYTGSSSFIFKNPIAMSFERHKGYVTSVEFSPFLRNVFMSSGSDGELRLYSLLQPKPVIVLQLPSGGIKSAQWSPVRPLVLSSLSDDGQLHIWDIGNSETHLVETLTLTAEKNGGSQLHFNKANHQLFATSTLNGEIQVWQLSSNLTDCGINEIRQLQELIKEDVN